MRVDRRLVAVCGLAVLPAWIAAIRTAGRGWTPSGEFAQAELRLRGFWADPPLLGAVGRLTADGVMTRHPGPAAWWLLYPVWALAGGGGAALTLATAALATAWVVVAVVVAWRVGGTGGAVVVGSVWVLAGHAVGSRVVTEPWNPWFAVPAFLCLLVATWAAVEGSRRALLVVVAAASFVVQAHVGYAPWALSATVAATAAVWFHRRDDRPGPSAARAVLGASAVGVLAWALPVVQQLTGDPGNLWAIVRAYRQADEPAAGWAAAGRALLGELHVTGPWLVPDRTPPDELRGGLGTVLFLAGWLAAVALAARRRDRTVLRLHLVLAGAVAVGVVTTARILGPVLEYLVPWWQVLAAAVAGASAWTVWRAGAERPGERRRTALRAALAVGATAATVVAAGAVAAAPVTSPGGSAGRITARLVDQLEPMLDRHRSHRIGWEDPVTFGAVGYGLVDALDARGVEVGGPTVFRPALGDRMARVTDPDVELVVVSGPRTARWDGWPGATPVARADPRTAAERRRWGTERRAIRAALVRVGGADLADLLDTNLFRARSDPRVSPALRSRIDRFGAIGLPTTVYRLEGAPPP